MRGLKILLLAWMLVPGLGIGSDDTDQKVPFASSEWFEMVRSVIKTYAAEHPELEVTINEVFTEVPERLNPNPDGKLAYTMMFKGGEAELRLEELPASETDIKVVGRWSAILRSAVYVVDNDSPESIAEYQEIGRRNMESGDVVVTISPDFKGSGGNELHNRIAARTKP